MPNSIDDELAKVDRLTERYYDKLQEAAQEQIAANDDREKAAVEAALKTAQEGEALRRRKTPENELRNLIREKVRERAASLKAWMDTLAEEDDDDE